MLFVWFLLAEDTLFWYVKMPVYKWEASHTQNPEANSQMALQVPSEVPEYGKCVRYTIACLGKKVTPNFKIMKCCIKWLEQEIETDTG